MPKIKPNAPCPCGSGKKFKKCHRTLENLPASQPTQQNAKANPQTGSLELFGLPGMPVNLTMRLQYIDKTDPRNFGSIGGVFGKYTVIFILNRPGFPLVSESRAVAGENLKGDSYLAIAKPALDFGGGEEFDRLRMETTTVNGNFVFWGYPNANGFLGKIESEPFDAHNFEDAAIKAHHAIAPALSNMSVFLDVPVNIFQIDVKELWTGSVQMSFKMPYREVVGWMSQMDNASEDQQKYVSLYREALNSNSTNYQYLCLYKIIEGLRERRSRLRKEAALLAKSKGEKPALQPEYKLPADEQEQKEWLNSLYPNAQTWDEMALRAIFISDVVEKKINHLIDKGQELHKLRNKIAHAVLDSGEPTFSIDNDLDAAQVRNWLPITKCLARYLLKECFPHIFENSDS